MKREEAIKSMGDKLLAGWTLLGEICPICNTPLMKDRNKSMWCLSCNVMIVSEEDYNPQIHKNLLNSDLNAPKSSVESNPANETNLHHKDYKSSGSIIIADQIEKQNLLQDLISRKEKLNKPKKNLELEENDQEIERNNDNIQNNNNDNINSNNNISVQQQNPKNEILSKELSFLQDKVIFPHHKLPLDHPLIINDSTFPEKKIPKKVAKKKKSGKSTNNNSNSNQSNNAPSIPPPSIQNNRPSPITNNNQQNFDDENNENLNDNNHIHPFSSLQRIQDIKSRCINAINNKLSIAIQLLESTDDIQQATTLIKFITECSNSLSSLQNLK